MESTAINFETRIHRIYPLCRHPSVPSLFPRPQVMWQYRNLWICELVLQEQRESRPFNLININFSPQWYFPPVWLSSKVPSSPLRLNMQSSFSELISSQPIAGMSTLTTPPPVNTRNSSLSAVNILVQFILCFADCLNKANDSAWQRLFTTLLPRPNVMAEPSSVNHDGPQAQTHGLLARGQPIDTRGEGSGLPFNISVGRHHDSDLTDEDADGEDETEEMCIDAILVSTLCSYATICHVYIA